MAGGIMGRITVDMTLDEMLALPELAGFAPYLVYAPAHVPRQELPTHGLSDMPLSALSSLGWSPDAIARGMSSFLEAMGEGRVSRHHVYEGTLDPSKRDVNIIRIAPEEPDPTKPIALLCSGGAYKNVCNIAEGITVGRHFVEAGYQTYLLTYRVSVPELAPLVLEDVATALAWLARHAEELSCDPRRYVIAGFSAGGNLACTWGLPEVGYAAHGIDRPLCVLAVYPCVDLVLESTRNANHGMLPRMFGDRWRERLEVYDVVGNVDGDYPACYIVCGKDDGLLSCRHAERLQETLVAAGVPSVLEEHEHAPHGFGDGTATDAAGWPERAMAFMEGLGR